MRTLFLFLLAVVGMVAVGQCDPCERNLTIAAPSEFTIAAPSEFTIAAPPELPFAKPTVDERVELLAIVFRLAGAKEFACKRFTKYDDAINAHFAEFKDHEVIQLAKELNKGTGLGEINISNDRVPAFAVACKITDGRVILTEENAIALEKYYRDLSWPCWPKATSLKFAQLLDDFYVKSRFHEFFVSQKDLYDRFEERFFDLYRFFNIGWFDTFYGTSPGERFQVYLLVTGEDGGYGTMLPRNDGTKDYCAIIGVHPTYVNDDGEPLYTENSVWSLMLFYNLFAFADPLVEKYYPLFKKASERLLPHTAERIQQSVNDVLTPKRVLQYYLTYATLAEYSKVHGHDDALANLTEIEKGGFVWFDKMREAVKRYTNDRDSYPTFDAFMPHLAEVQNAVVTDEFLRNLRRAKAKQ